MNSNPYQGLKLSKTLSIVPGLTCSNQVSTETTERSPIYKMENGHGLTQKVLKNVYRLTQKVKIRLRSTIKVKSRVDHLSLGGRKMTLRSTDVMNAFQVDCCFGFNSGAT